MGSVLIVEDERDTVELLRYNLGREGYETEVAMDGNKALKLFKKMNPDLVLLDVMLPEMDGRELCRVFRTINDSIPILMVSALGSESDRLDGLDFGADDYISKPFSIKEVMMKVKRHADKERKVRSLSLQAGEGDERIRYMVHELKNGLTSLEGFSNLAARKGEVDKYLPYIQSSAQHMNQVLDNIYLLKKLERGESLPVRDDIDILDEVISIINMSKESAREKSIKLSLLNDTTCAVRGDKTAIRQVLLNIISNGIKYNKKEGKVMIFFEDREDTLYVNISDTGIGIPSEDVNSIFEKDFRARGSEGISGTGLGLYFSKLLMSALDGKISVSRRIDGGTVFTLGFKKGFKMQRDQQKTATSRKELIH